MRMNHVENRSLWTLMRIGAFLVCTFPALAHAGANSGGGGDSYAAHFASVGKKLEQVYRRLCAAPAADEISVCQSQEAFSAAVNSAKVLPREQLFSDDGTPREAGPDGKGNIDLNVTLYKQRLADPQVATRIVSLVAHEYMIIAQKESKDSYLSSQMVAMLSAHYIDLSAIVGASNQLLLLILESMQNSRNTIDGADNSTCRSIGVSAGQTMILNWYANYVSPEISKKLKKLSYLVLTTQSYCDSGMMSGGISLYGIQKVPYRDINVLRDRLALISTSAADVLVKLGY